jgi:hypothetical protein
MESVLPDHGIGSAKSKDIMTIGRILENLKENLNPQVFEEIKNTILRGKSFETVNETVLKDLKSDGNLKKLESLFEIQRLQEIVGRHQPTRSSTGAGMIHVTEGPVYGHGKGSSLHRSQTGNLPSQKPIHSRISNGFQHIPQHEHRGPVGQPAGPRADSLSRGIVQDYPKRAPAGNSRVGYHHQHHPHQHHGGAYTPGRDSSNPHELTYFMSPVTLEKEADELYRSPPRMGKIKLEAGDVTPGGVHGVVQKSSTIDDVNSQKQNVHMQPHGGLTPHGRGVSKVNNLYMSGGTPLLDTRSGQHQHHQSSASNAFNAFFAPSFLFSPVGLKYESPSRYILRHVVTYSRHLM